MLLQESLDLFLEKYQSGKDEASANFPKFRKELKRFLRHCEAQIDPCQAADLSGEIIASFLSARAKKASGRPRKSAVLALRRFFEFLLRERLIETDLAAFLPAAGLKKNKAGNLLRQLQELEDMLPDLARVEQSRKKIAKIKKTINKLSRKDSPGATEALERGEQKISLMHQHAEAEREQSLQALFVAGEAVLPKNPELENLIQELNDLTKGVTRLGKEQYKVQTAIEAKQQHEAAFFDELQRRLARSERLMEEFAGLKQALYLQVTLEIIRDLLPVIDGLENAMALASSLNGKAPAPAEAEKSLLRKIFAPNAPAANTTPPDWRQWVEGLAIIRDRLLALFKKAGVAPIPSAGRQFDPQLHIAVAAESRDGVEPNLILKEQLKGYRRGEEIVRFAEVVVAK